MNRAFFAVLSFVLLFSLSACHQGLVYEKYLEIDNNSWEYESPVTFEIDVENINKKYDLYVNLRHSNDYPYSNIWLMLFSLPPDGQPTQQRIELKLARPDGSWIAKGNGGTITHEVRVRQGMKFDKPGTYTYTLQHDMRINQVPAVSYVGIGLKETKE